MSNKNLSTVTTDLIETYGNTAKNMIQAYRVGNLRAAQYIDQRWENALKQSASQMRAEVSRNALAAQKTISGMYVKGIDLTSNSADVVVDKVVAFAGKGVHQVVSNASAFEKRTGVATLNSLAKATAVSKKATSVAKKATAVSKKATSAAKKSAPVARKTTKRATAPVKTVAPVTTVAPEATVAPMAVAAE